MDTECTTLVIPTVIKKECKGMNSVKAVDGSKIGCKGSSQEEMAVRGKTLRLRIIVIGQIVNRIDVVMGMDAINSLDRVNVSGHTVSFGGAGSSCAVSL